MSMLLTGLKKGMYMNEKEIGFIGCEMMAQAMIGGILDTNVVSHDQIMASAISDKTVYIAKNKYHIHIKKDVA